DGSGCRTVPCQTFVAATATSLVGAAADGVPAHTAYWSTNGAASSNGSQTAVTQMQRRRTTASVDGACDKARNAIGTAKNTGNRKPLLTRTLASTFVAIVITKC